MMPYLPVEEDNPIRRLQLVSARMTRMKSTGQGQAGDLAMAAADRVPFALASWAVRLLTQLPQRAIAALATNVPGPQNPLQLMGRQIVQVLPVPPLAMQLRAGFSRRTRTACPRWYGTVPSMQLPGTAAYRSEWTQKPPGTCRR